MHFALFCDFPFVRIYGIENHRNEVQDVSKSNFKNEKQKKKSGKGGYDEEESEA